MNMTVDIEGAKQFTTDLKRFKKDYVDRPFVDKRLVRALKKIFFKYMRDVFASEGAESGPKWKDLSTKASYWKKGSSRSGAKLGGGGYKEWKAKKYPGKTILRREDRLYESLTKTGGEHVDFVKGSPHGSELWLGTEVPYAIYHDSKKPRKSKLPRRPILRLNDRVVDEFHRAIHKRVVYGLKQTVAKNRPPTWKGIDAGLVK